MGFTPFVFDESAAQTEPGRVRVPEGYYLLEGSKVEPTPENYEKTTGVIFHFVIREGAAGIGREINMFNGLSTGQRDGRGTQFGFGRALGALGQAEIAKTLAAQKVAIDSWAKLDGLCRQLTTRVTGKRCVALIADDTVNGRAISSIQELLPADEWQSFRGVSITSAARPTAAAPVNNGAAPAATADVGSLNAEIDAMFNLPA